MLVNRDPFARTELHRITIRWRLGSPFPDCKWCGSTRKDGSLYQYYTETDGGSKHYHKGQFCCKSCHDSYHD